MFAWLWNYFNGYVIIKVSGFSAERFINIAVMDGINIWDIKYDGTARIMKVRLYGFKLADIQKTARRCGCKIEIIKKCGLPFKLNRILKKRAFSAGIVIFSATLFLLTQFIWVVETEGNETVPTREILDFCSENGVAPARLKNAADYKQLGKLLVLEFDNIGWAAVNIKGTRVVISIAENIPQSEIETPPEFCRKIVASKNGIIESIMVESGTAIVKAGDVAECGEVLIADEIVLKDGETETGRKYESAKGEVRAKTAYSFLTKVEKTRYIKKYTGESKRYFILKHNGENTVLFRPEENDKLYDEKSLYTKVFKIGDFEFPIKLECREKNFYTVEEGEIGEEELKKIVLSRIEEKKEEILTGDAEIIKEESKITDKGTFIQAETSIFVMENIAKSVETENIRGDFINNE